MKNNPKKQCSEFFAAQNSYFGFISHFDSIFDSEKFDAIFVLKGGPGTGKSSFMKKIAKRFENEADITKIYCSSDANSLDGVIIAKENRQVAILDGTAPHQRDAVIPGAVDELINLGECWRSEKLKERKEEILSLNNEKKAYYNVAYDFLSIAGLFYQRITKKCNALIDKSRAHKLICELCSGLDGGARYGGDLLLSAFGKEGYQTLPSAVSHTDETVRITGDYFSAAAFMDMLCREFSIRRIKHTIYPAPLNPDIPETVIVSAGEKSIAYSTAFGKKEISTSDLLAPNQNERAILNLYLTETQKYENLARDSFEAASKVHFILEDIYTPLMDFSAIDKIITNTEKKIAEAIE